MMNNNKINNAMMGTYIHNDESHNFVFCTNLSAYDKLKFVNSVVDTLVNEDRYNSIVRELVFGFEIIKRFTDIDTSIIYTDLDADGKPINSVDDIERFIIETNIIEIVKANTPFTLFDELNKAIDDNIAYLTGVRPNSLNDALVDLISTLEKKINEVDLNSMMDMAQNFAASVGEPTLENVVNAYINSDIHKKNLEEIAKTTQLRTEFAEDMDKAINENENFKTSKRTIEKFKS